MRPLTYGSVCSGIEAASVAWEELGWKPAWFSEIELFPSSVLSTHWPEVPNLGDMTKIAAAVRAGCVPAPDIGVGGTPCQAFSIAGLRAGLADERGQLTLSYIELANAIDEKRISQRQKPAIFVWENVPGVLSSADNAFGHFLAGLAGEDEAFQPGPRPENGKNSKYWRWSKASGCHVPKWSKSGCIIGRQRRLAWRILDAQHFGVAQRRRRVFVVASARTDIDPTKILLECDGVRRDTPPRRSKREEIAGTLKARANSGGWSSDVDMASSGYMQVVGSHWDDPDNPHPTLNQSNNTGGIGLSNQELFSQHGSGIVAQSVSGTISHTLKADGFDASEDGTGRGTPIIAMAHGQGGAEIKMDGTAPTLTCNHEAPIVATADPLPAYGIPGNWIGRTPNNGGNSTEPPFNISPCLTVTDRHGVAYGFQPRIARNGRGDMGDLCHTLSAQSGETGKGDSAPCVAVAFAENTRGEIRLQAGNGTITGPLSAGGGKPGQGYPAVANGLSVRRLTPIECERLQGFPDGHTLIPTAKRKRITEDEFEYLRAHRPELTIEEAYRLAADGPRYKAIGNSMAVPVMKWIGQRIDDAVNSASSEDIEPPEPAQPTQPAKRAKPFLKWAGGKFSVLDDILPHLPHGKRLIEPFAGAGSIFMNAGFSKVVASDACADLILTYQELKNQPYAVIDMAEAMFREGNNPDYYDKVKDRFNNYKYSPLERAAAFIYINRHCYNGLTRYNKKLIFNVGFGAYKKPYFPRKELENFVRIAPSITFGVFDFSVMVGTAGTGDVVFCDPPYEPLPGKRGFTNYNGKAFTFQDQIRLADELVAAHQRGASIVVTNSNAPSIVELYESKGFKVKPLQALRSISCEGDGREFISDIIGTLI